jgi:ribosomal protein S20
MPSTEEMAKAILARVQAKHANEEPPERTAYKEAVKSLMDALKGEDVEQASALLADAVALAGKNQPDED